MKLFDFLPQGLNASLLVNVFGWGIIFTVLITIAQMLYQFENRRGEVELRVTQALEEAMPGISTSVYTADEEQLKLQLQLLFNNSAIVFLQVTEIKGIDYYYTNLGVVETPYDFIVERTLTYNVGSLVKLDFGGVVVFGSYNALYTEILKNAIRTLISNLILTLLICLIMFLTINNLVIRHLRALIDDCKDLSIDRLHTTIRLKRNTGVWSKNDELEQLAAAINQTRHALQEELFKHNKARTRAKAISLNEDDELEALFHRDSTERQLQTAITNAKMYRSGFATFWISVENYDDISLEVGDEIRDQGIQIFSKRMFHKIKNAIKHLDIEDFELSSFARVSDHDFVAAVIGINSRVNAASFCKRIHDVANVGIEVGARRMEINISQACVVCNIPETVNVKSLTQRVKHNLITAKVESENPLDFKIEVIGANEEQKSSA